MSNVVEKVKAKIDNVLHKDDHTVHNTAGTHQHAAGTHHHQATDNYPVGTGAAPVHNTHTTGTGYGSTATDGPHNSNIANKLDPRVDSDRDGSHNMGAASYGAGGAANPNTNTGYGNQSSTVGSGTGYGSTSTAGPHNSNIANKLDPRVDSDRDGSHNMGASSYGPGSHPTTAGVSDGYGTHQSHQVENYGGAQTTGRHTGTHTADGPHNSAMLNKLDPRVDSDRDGSHNMGAASYGQGGVSNPNTTTGAGVGGGYGTQAGYNGAQTTAGPHSSNLANKLDPRVDSDNDGSRNAGVAQTGQGATYNASTGPASATAGHHGSNLLNKLDPRVDSDASNNNIHGGVGAHTTHGHHNPNTTF